QSIWLKENPRINLPMPIKGAIRTVDGTNEITLRKFALYSPSNPLNPNSLTMQVEGETLQPKTPFWKQAGIYGLEFAVAGTSVLAGYWYSLITVIEGDAEYWDMNECANTYIISNLLVTSTCTWGTGKLLGQKGSWWKTAIGAGIGGAIGSIPARIDINNAEGILFWSMILGLPTIGAVIGFNL
ncbi:MAG: hypothetical protein ACUVQ3_05435, partial [bacterium]